MESGELTGATRSRAVRTIALQLIQVCVSVCMCDHGEQPSHSAVAIHSHPTTPIIQLPACNFIPNDCKTIAAAERWP